MGLRLLWVHSFGEPRGTVGRNVGVLEGKSVGILLGAAVVGAAVVGAGVATAMPPIISSALIPG